MPLVTIRALEEVFTPEQREELMSRITEAVVAVQGERVRSVTWVLFDEIRPRHIAIGGEFQSASDVTRREPPHADRR
jgi:4-oxalocrotonate tautomerase